MSLLGTARFILWHPLGKRAPLRAFGRFASWQVRSRLRPGPRVVPFVEGASLRVQRGMNGATGNLYVGLHDFEDMAFVLHGLRSTDLFVDVGANVGSYTVLAAAVVGARCVSIEPVPATVASLRENLALNRIEPLVELHPCAVGDREGLVVMTADQDSTNRVVSDEANARSATVRVPLRTVDQLLAERAPFMLKIDVEGFEAATLRGAVRALAQPTLHACILETLGAGAGGAVRAADWEPSAMLLEHGFKPAAYDPWRRTLTPIEQLDTAGNTLFIRDRAELEARLLGARSFVALGQRV